MKRTPLFAPVMLLLMIGLLGLFAVGCAPATSVEAALHLQATATPASVDTGSADGSPADDMPDEQIVAEATLIPDANCITCHQDAAQLQLVAEEEEVKENLSEGSG